MAGSKNYYKELGVPRNASAATIEEAWKQWKRDPNNHPDTHPDPNVKARVESEFQQRSAAYLILSNPTDRRRHDADLRSREATSKKPTTDGPQGANSGYDVPDPGSEDADWGDGPAAGSPPPPNYSPPSPSYSPGKSGFNYGKAFKYSAFLVLAVASLMLVMYLVQRAMSPAAAGVALVPQTTPTPNSVTAVVPTDTPTPDPSSSPTSSPNFCPVGSPVVSILSATVGSPQYQGSAQESVTYTVSGQISNPTSVPIEITSPGVGFYIGQPQTGTPPVWADMPSDMSISPSSSNPNIIPAESSVSFTSKSIQPGEGTPQTEVSASLDFPATATSGKANNWSWLGSTAGCTTPGQ